MNTTVNNNNTESNNIVNNTLPAWCKNGQHVLFEGRLHVIECAPKKEYEHLHEVIIEDCETHHCHFENCDNLTPCAPDGRDLLPELPVITEAEDIPAADLCWNMDEDGVKVWGNMDQHAENLTRMGAKRGRVVFKSNKTGLPTGADCWVLPKEQEQAVRKYIIKTHDRISRDFSEAREKYGDKGHKYHEGEKVMTIYGRGTVVRGRACYASDLIDVQLDTPTYNYIWSLLGTPQKMVAVSRDNIVSIELPEPPAEVHIDAA